MHYVYKLLASLLVGAAIIYGGALIVAVPLGLIL